jgi:hypothetical protein
VVGYGKAKAAENAWETEVAFEIKIVVCMAKKLRLFEVFGLEVAGGLVAVHSIGQSTVAAHAGVADLLEAEEWLFEVLEIVVQVKRLERMNWKFEQQAGRSRLVEAP